MSSNAAENADNCMQPGTSGLLQNETANLSERNRELSLAFDEVYSVISGKIYLLIVL